MFHLLDFKTMNFFDSTQFYQFLASIIGGAFTGYWFAGWQHRRKEAKEARRRAQYLRIPFRGYR